MQTSFWCSLNISFKIVPIGLQYSKGFWKDQDLTQFSDKILCDDSTGCDEVDKCFAIEEDTIISILYEYVLDEDWF